MSVIQVEGDRLAHDGEPVVLRGAGLGGWMNMENFITGYPGTESQHRAAVRAALGEEGYRRYFDRFLDVFFGEADAAYLASLGLNCLRIPFHYHHFESDDAPFALREDGFALLDRVVDRCARHGIYTVLDLHALPGYQNQGWHCDNPTHKAFFWQHRHFQDRVVHLWEALAARYAGNPWVAGYNPVNEPADPSGEVIGPFYRRLAAAIRTADPDHVLFLDGNTYSTDFSTLGEPLPNTVYTAHDYAGAGLIEGGDYPGMHQGEYVDRAALERQFLDRTAYMRATGTPVWIGEFGPVYTGDPARDEHRYRLLADQLEIYREHRASWSIWTYKDIGLQGLVHLPPDSPYLRHIAPVLEQKARLGVDSWGSRDTGVRHLLEPIEHTLAEELPGFDPYPSGPRHYVHTLVRHLLLAEALAGEFGRCLAGLSPPQAEQLAGAFAFDACVRREPLAALLAAESR